MTTHCTSEMPTYSRADESRIGAVPGEGWPLIETAIPCIKSASHLPSTVGVSFMKKSMVTL